MKLTSILIVVVLFTIVTIKAWDDNNDSDNSDRNATNISDGLDQTNKTSLEDNKESDDEDNGLNGKNDDRNTDEALAMELLAHDIAEAIAELEATNDEAAVHAPEPTELGKEEGNTVKGDAAENTSTPEAGDDAAPKDDVDNSENQAAEAANNETATESA